MKKQKDWDSLSYEENLSMDFIMENRDKLNFEGILFNYKFNEDQLEEIIPYFTDSCWGILTQNNPLSESFMTKHSDKIEWNSVWDCQIVSEKFTVRNIAKINWYSLSISDNIKNFSQEFLEDHSSSIYWNYVKGIELQIVKK